LKFTAYSKLINTYLDKSNLAITNKLKANLA